MSEERISKAAWMAIIVAALGYFVDVFDLLLFSAVRVSSLQSLGLTPEEVTSWGVFLLNTQLVGLLVGGVAWGILGDKRGRISVLFGSIILYSIANIANGFISSVEGYAVCRFIAGLGLAGELGAGITLVSELLPARRRGYGTTIVATVGVAGSFFSGLCAQLLDWKTAYIVGGCAGLALLVLRIAVCESGMFEAVKSQNVARGQLRMLFNSRERFGRYMACICAGVPIWFVVGVVMTFSPEIAINLGVTGPIEVPKLMMFHTIGITLGDLSSGLLSQYLQSRKQVLYLFLGCATVVCTVLLTLKGGAPISFYLLYTGLAFFIGYWAVFVTTAAEQFGTNMRATVATSVPNMVRGLAFFFLSAFQLIRPSVGPVSAAQVLGLWAALIAFFAITRMRESFGTELNYLELSGREKSAKNVVKLPAGNPERRLAANE